MPIEKLKFNKINLNNKIDSIFIGKYSKIITRLRTKQPWQKVLKFYRYYPNYIAFIIIYQNPPKNFLLKNRHKIEPCLWDFLISNITFSPFFLDKVSHYFNGPIWLKLSNQNLPEWFRLKHNGKPGFRIPKNKSK